ncbi:MAG TPA: ABC transporter permease [Gemmatimonadaceae bacterium]|nr:ABC transporter permease [Gemmatimonadaceae bacterium]
MGSHYLLRRIAQAVLTILFILVLNFLLFRLMPGSPERSITRNPNIPAEVKAELRARWGLDKPVVPDQFVAYLGDMSRGDLGFSFKYRGAPVTEVIGDRIWPTVILFGVGEAIAIVVGLGLGAYAGWRRGGAVDYVGNGISLVLYSMPYFVLGMLLLMVFSRTLGWFPTSGMLTAGATYASFADQLADFAWHFALPLATVSLGLIGLYSILMRSAIIETLAEEYVQTARAKGLRDGRILRRHALPNAILPAVTVVAIQLGYVVAGAITAEVVFNWPGLGTLTVTALSARDYPVLQGVFLLLAVSVVVANLIADLLYSVLDPRVRV